MKRFLFVLLFCIITGIAQAGLRGDVDNNGKVNIFDLLELLKILSGTYSPEEPKPETSDTTSFYGIKLISIPAGSFKMGSDLAESKEMPVHTVSLDAFRISATEITQAQYIAVMTLNPSYRTRDNNLPVEQVSWINAATFCNRLSQSFGLVPCYNLQTWKCDFTKNGFRLPTEAEWEYACRAGTTTNYYTGNNESDLERAGWYEKNSSGDTHPVSQKTPNTWGLYDMHGNVSEWCNDWEHDYKADSLHNPTGPDSLSGYFAFRIIRGGDFYHKAFDCRSSSRGGYIPDRNTMFTGFRVIRRP